MKLHERLSELQTLQLPNGTQVSGKIRHTVYKIESDDDAKELVDLFAEGVDITMAGEKYIFVRKFEKSKLSLAKETP